MRGDAGQEAKVWLDRLAEADTMRRGFQEQAAKELTTLEELEERLKKMDDIRETARADLATLEGSRQRLEELEHDQQALMDVTPARCRTPSITSSRRSVTGYTRCSG